MRYFDFLAGSAAVEAAHVVVHAEPVRAGGRQAPKASESVAGNAGEKDGVETLRS